MAYTTQDIRNVCLTGHAGSGKTMLAEAMLKQAGVINHLGDIERGTTVSDFDPMEKQYQHSLQASVCHLDYEGSHINLLDSPGYPDFAGRGLAVLPAVETAVIVINAQTGVEMVTQNMMDSAKALNLCRMIVVNKIDGEDTDVAEILDQIQTVFGAECLPLNLPAQQGKAVADCFFTSEEQETDISSVADSHEQIIEQAVEVNEELMEAYLEQGDDLDPKQVHDAFEQAMREGHLIPVCFTSAETGVGVAELLTIICKLMPNPLESNRVPFVNGLGEDADAVELDADRQGNAIAHVFKISVDPYKGQLAVFRIHQGSIHANSQVFVDDVRKPLKIAHLLKLNGSEVTEISTGIPGDICAVSKAEDIQFNAVVHDSHDEDSFLFKADGISPPMYGLAITPSRHGDEQRVSDVLHKLLAEDPCLALEHNRTLNETVLKGMGELHLRVVLEKMKEQYNVQVDTHPPRITYRETITTKADGHHRHKKQTGGAGQFGEVYLNVEPLPRGGGFEFVDKVVGGVIPHQFIPAVEKGILQVLDIGAVAGYPMQDIRVTVYDGKHHSVDAKEIAFVQAGKKAFMEAVNKARPILLEPIVNITVNTPNEFMGDINGDISTMRGVISGAEALPGGRVQVLAQVPLKEISDYHSRLKSVTEGEGSYTMEFDHYAPLPALDQRELVKAYNPEEED